MAATDTTGTVLTFGTSTLTMELLNINFEADERQEYEITHMGSSQREWQQSGIDINGGILEIEHHHIPADQMDAFAAEETLQVDWGGNDKWLWSRAYQIGYAVTGELGGRLVATSRWRCTGDLTYPV